MTIDRLIHFCVGVLFFYGFMKLNSLKIRHSVLLLGFIAMGLGTWISDWDLLLGIGFHRNPITHSFLPALLVGWSVFKLKMPVFLIIGFSLGLSSHLFWDIIAFGNVHWVPGGNNDRIYLLFNSIILIVAAMQITNKFLKQDTSGTSEAAPVEI